MLLLDTNVVSELRKVAIGRADPNVARWAAGVDAKTLFISAITIHELEVGVLRAEHRDPWKGNVPGSKSPSFAFSTRALR